MKLNPFNGWMSPNFDEMGCIGALIFYIIMVAALAGLLYLPWSLLLNP